MGPILPLWFMKNAYIDSLVARGKTKAILQGSFCSYFHSDAGDLRARCTGCFDCRDRPRARLYQKHFQPTLHQTNGWSMWLGFHLTPRCKLFVSILCKCHIDDLLTWTKELIVIGFLFILFLLSGFWRKGLLFSGCFHIIFGRRFFAGQNKFNSNHPAGFLFP